jgi:aldose 1-epimerase
MRIRIEGVGSTAAGDAVEAYTMTSDAGVAVTVWTYGATLVEVLVPDESGRRDNVVRRLPDLAAYESRALNPYVGSTVGRYCRGVRDATFELDGKRHHLARNDGRHHVHGGPDGFDRRVWQARAEPGADESAVVLTLVSPDGDQGYPGTVTVEVAYRLRHDGRLTFDYAATTDRPTILGLTNHAFWNLAGTGVIDDHRLAVNAAVLVPFDDELTPLPGGPVPVAALDYRSARPIGGARLDNLFVLDDPAWAATLADPHSGRHMRVVTDQPGIGIYSGDFFPQPRAGICLEAGAWPDAPNRPDFPPVRLDPGQTYHHRTTHEFWSAAPPRPPRAPAPPPQ